LPAALAATMAALLAISPCAASRVGVTSMRRRTSSVSSGNSAAISSSTQPRTNENKFSVIEIHLKL
jgi:hypothetical protein